MYKTNTLMPSPCYDSLILHLNKQENNTFTDLLHTTHQEWLEG